MRCSGVIVGALVLVACAACTRVPYTNRSQLVLVSANEEAQLGAQAFAEVTRTSAVIRGGKDADLVRDVGRRLAAVAGRPDFDWEFILLRGDEVNAFALPGGKTAVYMGLLPVARDTAGLAVVMGHEIAHAIARHGAERMSQAQVLSIGGQVLGAAVGGEGVGRAAMAAYGLGAQVGVLMPFGRSQEAEADDIGLILMAKAGYDPRAAVSFWERMEASSDGKAPPEWLSTHPSHGTRRAGIRTSMDKALELYRVASPAPVVRLD
jgi:predicted Zn-dependent protease